MPYENSEILRCAVVDDYRGVAFEAADWSMLKDRVDLRSVTRPLSGVDDLVEAVGDCEILVAMLERTPFPAEAFRRLGDAGDLRLLVSTGMRNASIDLTAAARHGVTVCDTGSEAAATAELTWALILGAVRDPVAENT